MRGRPRGLLWSMIRPRSKIWPPQTPVGSARSTAPARQGCRRGQPWQYSLARLRSAGRFENHRRGFSYWQGKPLWCRDTTFGSSPMLLIMLVLLEAQGRVTRPLTVGSPHTCWSKIDSWRQDMEMTVCPIAVNLVAPGRVRGATRRCVRAILVGGGGPARASRGRAEVRLSGSTGRRPVRRRGLGARGRHGRTGGPPARSLFQPWQTAGRAVIDGEYRKTPRRLGSWPGHLLRASRRKVAPCWDRVMVPSLR